MVEINNKTNSRIDLVLIKRVAEKFLAHYKKKDQEISVVFIGDRVMRRLNRKYRGADRVTDVLAFPGEDNFLGEIIIDYAQIKRQASHFAGSIKKELIFILGHGLLHLLGYEDKTEKGREEMQRINFQFLISNFQTIFN